MNRDVVKFATLELLCGLKYLDYSCLNCFTSENSFEYNFNNLKFNYVCTNPPYGGDKCKTTL